MKNYGWQTKMKIANSVLVIEQFTKEYKNYYKYVDFPNSNMVIGQFALENIKWLHQERFSQNVYFTTNCFMTDLAANFQVDHKQQYIKWLYTYVIIFKILY